LGAYPSRPTLAHMTPPAELAIARKAYDAHAWRDAREAYALAASQVVLEPDDLEQFARSALLTGDDEAYVDGLAQASQAWASQGELARAAECACYAAMNLGFRGEWVLASGWQARAEELLKDDDCDCPAQVLVRGMQAIPSIQAGNPDAAYERFREAAEIAGRCGEPSSAAMARIGVGQSLVELGRVAEGIAQLENVMLSVIAGEVNPIVSGIAYCTVIGACTAAFDPKRAGEWTRALSRWCEGQPDLVPFRGQCLVHRAQIMQLRGFWPDAMEQIDEACTRLSAPPGHPAVGEAYYEQAELYRLRGDLSQAERSYVLAAEYGREAQPGLALLRLAQGRRDASRAGITRALAEIPGGPLRSSLLAAAVEIAIAAGDLDAAESAAAELSTIAAGHDSVLLTAMATQAAGAVLLARGAWAEALPVLRRSWNAWQDVDAPYFAARVRVLVGQACRDSGDLDATRMELDAARAVFDRLGAEPDLRALREVSGISTLERQPGGLTAREIEVLQLVAAGKTNRTIATELFLSGKTVARHVANIFIKLNVSSRAAATGYAYEHDLMDRT
jgi:DNA-binding CsgD family transcriptional regulator/tetratricopeptide (TPR) repeat protein